VNNSIFIKLLVKIKAEISLIMLFHAVLTLKPINIKFKSQKNTVQVK